MTSKKHPTEWKPPTSFKQLLRYMRKAFPNRYKFVSVEITDSSVANCHDVKVTTYLHDSSIVSGISFARAWMARMDHEFPPTGIYEPVVDVTDGDLKETKDEEAGSQARSGE